MAKLPIYGEISESSNSAEVVANFLDLFQEENEIILEINSNGGSVDEAIAIYELLKYSGKKIKAHVYKAASAATIILLAAEERLISKNAPFIIHFPYISNIYGDFTSEDLKKLNEAIEKYDKKILSIYKEGLGLDSEGLEVLQTIMKENKDIGADGALKLGFATGLLDETTVKNNVAVIAFAKEVNDVLNNYKPKQTIINQTKTTMKTKKTTKSWLASILNNAGLTVKATSIELEDGSSIYFEGETIEVGTYVYADEALTIPLAAGEYTLPDGRTLIVEAKEVDGVAVAVVTDIVEQLSEETQKLIEEIVNFAALKIKALQKKVDILAKENEALKKSAIPAKKIEKPDNQNFSKTKANSNGFASFVKNMASSSFNS